MMHMKHRSQLYAEGGKMKLFRTKQKTVSRHISPEIACASRYIPAGNAVPAVIDPLEAELYDRLRYAVPVLDAAIMKIIRLTGGFRVVSSDENYQEQLDSFLEEVPVGLTGQSVGTFADNFLDSLLTYGSAVGEIAVDTREKRIAGLWNGDVTRLRITSGADPFSREYMIRDSSGTEKKLERPERILYSSLIGGHSLLRGLPALSSILLRIYECIGQNFDRAGNIRYAITYKPSGESGDIIHSRERAQQIAKEWADGMNSARYGQVKDFVAVGDVDIKVIGAENQLFDTNIPVRQLLEQLISKLSIPPFLLGLTWSSTERMSSQQADILTSELEYYRRLLSPVITQIGNAYLCSVGADAVCHVEWDNINLQDEAVLAESRLKNAQALEIEKRLAGESEK